MEKNYPFATENIGLVNKYILYYIFLLGLNSTWNFFHN